MALSHEGKGSILSFYLSDHLPISGLFPKSLFHFPAASAVIQSLTAVEQDPVSSHQTRSNPFKLTPNTKAKSTSSSRGTSYFESLKSTLPPRNKPGKLVIFPSVF